MRCARHAGSDAARDSRSPSQDRARAKGSAVFPAAWTKRVSAPPMNAGRSFSMWTEATGSPYSWKCLATASYFALICAVQRLPMLPSWVWLTVRVGW